MNFLNFKNSLINATRGFFYVLKNEQNFRIQLVVSLLVIILTQIFHIRKSELIVIILLIMIVLILELLNSALEKFADILMPRLSLQIQVVKDITASMVLLASFFAAGVGLFIFWPYFLEFIS